MKYLITGGAGFVGSCVADKLLEDTKNFVTVLDNLSYGNISFIEKNFSNNQFNFIKEDLLNFSSLCKIVKGYDFIFHFASNSDISKSEKQPDIDFNLGIVTTYNLLEAMRKNNIKKIIYSSGSGIYGNDASKNPEENHGPLLPVSLYGASKLASEALISSYCHMFNMQSWIFRLANIVGKSQTHGVCFDFIKKLKTNSKNLLILGDGNQSKSYIYISDVINAFFHLANETNDIVNVFNIASKDTILVREIADIIINEMNLKNVQIEYTGSKAGWNGDVPLVKLNVNKAHSKRWKAKYNSRESIKKAVREILDKE